MFFRIIRIILATAILAAASALPVSAGEANDDSTAARLQIACPEARLLQFRQGRITWLGDRRKDEETRQCLNRAYGEILKDPFPVNMTGYCSATKVTVTERGTIVLSC